MRSETKFVWLIAPIPILKQHSTSLALKKKLDELSCYVPYVKCVVFPDGSDSKKKSACSAGDLGWEDPLEEGMQPTPVFLPGEFHGQRNLVGYSPRIAKSWTRLSD